MKMPPLRERPEDLVVLAELFASEARAPLRTELLKPFLDYDWPGNVRELRNTVIRLVILPETAEAPPKKAPPTVPGIYDAQGNFHPWLEARRLATANLERDYFAALLAHTNGNITKAAEIAGVSRQAVSVVANRWSLVQRREPTT
jgi:DNA-binding NtrC family response regulator